MVQDKGTPQFVAARLTGITSVSSETMTAKVGDVFFCASYGNVITVTGATITDSGQPQTGYYYCVATATSTSVTFSLVSGQQTRFQIGQFR